MYSKSIEEFLKFLKDSEESYNISKSTQEETEQMTQDLLHQLELGDNSYHDSAKLAKALSEIRKERRSSKYTITQLEPIVTWINENKTTIRGLEKLLGTVRKEEKNTDPNNLYYHNRTDIVKEILGKEK